MFSCCHSSSLRILESASNSFETVYLTKPASSKAGNSELYLIMLNYCGRMDDISLLENTHSFLQSVYKEIEYFVQSQISAIETNLSIGLKMERIKMQRGKAMAVTAEKEVECVNDEIIRYESAMEIEIIKVTKEMEKRFNFNIGISLKLTLK